MKPTTAERIKILGLGPIMKERGISGYRLAQLIGKDASLVNSWIRLGVGSPKKWADLDRCASAIDAGNA